MPCGGNYWLLNSSWRYCNTTVGISSPFYMFFHQFYHSLDVHDVKWQSCLSTLRSMNIMTQVCFGSTYFGAHHILVLANTSSWAWHAKATMWAIWANPKSLAHLATLPFPNTAEFGRTPQGMLHT